MLGQQLPYLGYYNTAVSITESIGETELSVGDAIDDLTDIYRALKAVY